jgi:hypothetical protein
MREDADRFVTRRQAATEAGVHYNSIRSWTKAGLVRCQRARHGGVEMELVHLGDVLKVAAERKQGSEPVSQLIIEKARLEGEIIQLKERIKDLTAILTRIRENIA